MIPLQKLAVNMRSSRFLTVIVHLPIFYSAVSFTAVLFFVVVYLSRETPAAAILVGILGTGLSTSERDDLGDKEPCWQSRA